MHTCTCTYARACTHTNACTRSLTPSCSLSLTHRPMTRPAGDETCTAGPCLLRQMGKGVHPQLTVLSSLAIPMRRRNNKTAKQPRALPKNKRSPHLFSGAIAVDQWVQEIWQVGKFVHAHVVECGRQSLLKFLRTHQARQEKRQSRTRRSRGKLHLRKIGSQRIKSTNHLAGY